MLTRLARILAGYLACCCVPHIPVFLFSGDAEAIAGMLHPLTILVVALFAAYVTVIPATAVIVAGEIFGLRRWYYYVLGAGVSSQFQVAFGAQYNTSNLDAAALFFAGGSLSGFVYWAIAGRVAGAWRRADGEP